MKKILLATTLLAASTGFAAAEVAVSGSARMGLIYDGNDTLFTQRVRVVFSLSGETDGGLTFGASVRADQDGGSGNDAGDDTSGTNGEDSTVYVSGAFGKLTMGDNDSAANVLVGHVSGVGLTGLGDFNELGYLGQDDTSALYEYSTGALSFALSAGQTDTVGRPTTEAMSVAVKYATDAFSVALGYEDTAADEQLTLGGSATFGAATVKVVAADRDSWADTNFALSVDYTAGAAVVTGFYADHGAVDGFGLGVAYDLGGGAKVVGGVVDNGVDTIADLGVSMSF